MSLTRASVPDDSTKRRLNAFDERLAQELYFVNDAPDANNPVRLVLNLAQFGTVRIESSVRLRLWDKRRRN